MSRLGPRSSAWPRLIRTFFGLFCLSLFGSATTWAEPALDVSKLNPGDKLEMQRGLNEDGSDRWVSIEFVGKSDLSDLLAKVRSPDFPQPIDMPISALRLAAKTPNRAADRPGRSSPDKPSGGAEPPPGAKNPAGAGKEQTPAAGPRTWTSRGGKFTIEATLVRAEDGKVVLRRSDNKEVTVPLDQLSDADQKFVAALTGVPKPSDAGAFGITPTDLDEARVVDFSHAGQWSYQPDSAPSRGSLRPMKIALKPGEFFDTISQLFVLPAEKRAVLVYVNHDPRSSDDPVCSVQLCDLANAKVEATGVFATGVAPIDVASNGLVVLARSEAFGLDTNQELRLYTRDANKVKQVKAWTPYAGRSSSWLRLREMEGVSQEMLDHARDRTGHFNTDANVTWAIFVDPRHVLTMGGTGEIALWEVPELKPVYVTKMLIDAQAGFSPGRKYIAVLTGEGVAIMRTLDGEVVGKLAADTDGFSRGMLAFSGDGKRLALYQGTRLRVWDLTNRELTRDFAVVSESHLAGRIVWVGNDHLLVGGYSLVDVVHRVVVATYAHGNHLAEVCDDLVWMTDRQATQLVAEKTPSKAALDLVSDLRPDDLLKIRPGMEVVLDLTSGTGANPAEMEQAREAIMRRLEKHGVAVVPQSEVRLVGTILPGKSSTIEYTEVTPPYTGGGSFTATEQVVSLSYEIAGQTVWKYESRTHPPHRFTVKNGENPQEILDRIMRQSPTSLGRIWIPSYIAQLPEGRRAIPEGSATQATVGVAQPGGKDTKMPPSVPRALRRRGAPNR